MNLKDKVSILIPVYNREDLISQTLDSALNQTYNNIEIIIVDNASTDNTWKVIQSYEKQDNRIKAFRNDTNIGIVKNWRKCLDHSTGVYGKILWSDDLIAHDFIEKTIPWLEDEDVGFVFTGTEIFHDNSNKKIDTYFVGKTEIYNNEKFIEGALFEGDYPVSPGCALFRLIDLKKNLLIDIPNKVNIDFANKGYGNDLLIFLLTANQYSKFAFVNEKLSYFRAHEGSISIQSKSGKLFLHYDLAKAYFVENYRKDLIKKMNADIWIALKLFNSTSKKYKLEKIEDFYIINTEFKFNLIDFIYILHRFFKKFIKKLGF